MAGQTKFKNNYLFDYLENILKTKSDDLFEKHINDPDFESSFSPFMIIRYLSMSKAPTVRNIILENQLVFERFIGKRELYACLMAIIPRQNSSFIKYLK